MPIQNTRRVDINCDLGEGTGNDRALMPWISSANIACGYHAGDEDEMKYVIDLCLQQGVAVGAHPSFLDRKNFGRTNMFLPSSEVTQLVMDQLYRINQIAQPLGAQLHHVKPHGALYNMAAKDAGLAQAIAKAIKEFNSQLILYGLAQSVMIAEAQKLNLKTAHEVFADRTYQPDGSLTPRTQPNALLNDPPQVLQQVIDLVTKNKVCAANGHSISLPADTICLHGDGPQALVLAQLIHNGLMNEGVQIQTLT
ncbi:MAG: LamB/YcsF family protein [Bacteroidetes bacterium]|nr:LamB/YcsF family protein [Bacteroidota bacterium]